MTRLSRFAREGSGCPTARVARTLRIASWHALCIGGLGGCFYVEPAWRPIPNEPPTLIRVDPPMPTLFFERDTERITVIAVDPEAGPLSFVWQLPPFTDAVQNTVPTNDVYVGTLDLAYAPDLDGERIVLTIIDDDLEDPGERTLEWQVEAP